MSPRTPRTPRTRGALVLWPLALAVLVLGVYAPTLDNPFVFDSLSGLLRNPAIRDPARIPGYFVDARSLTTARGNEDYRPLLLTGYALNHVWTGYRTWSWHLVNLSLHLVACLGVFAIGRRLFGSLRVRDVPWISPEDGDRAAIGAAFLFGLHPMNTGCVNYLWARSSLQVAALILPATALELARIREPGPAKTVGVHVLFAMALYTKVEAISFFAVMYLIRLLLGGRPRPEVARSMVGALLIVAVYLGCRWTSMPLDTHEFGDTRGIDPWTYLCSQARVWWDYLARCVAPHGFVLDDASDDWANGLGDPGVLRGALAGVLVIVLTWVGRHREPEASFLVLSWWLHLSPHSSVVPILQMSNEHRPYLATAGLMVLIVAGLLALLRRGDYPVAAPRLATLLLLGSLMTMTRLRNRIWEDEVTLWTHVVAERPRSYRALVNLGASLANRGELETGERHLREALRLAPDFGFAHLALAQIREAGGDLDGARRGYDEAVRRSRPPDRAIQRREAFRRRDGGGP